MAGVKIARWVYAAVALLFAFTFRAASDSRQSSGSSHSSGGWSFAVSGDSRNCGDVVMPAIAAGVKAKGAAFYWHLGDFRKISDFDEDMQHQPAHLRLPMSISTYYQIVWNDFLENQIASFAPVPIYLGIGNHDATPPKTREQFIMQFADWLDKPELREQRLRDDPHDHALKTYYHWVKDGVDFINMDNATQSDFGDPQVAWVEKVLQSDSANDQVQTIVVGMHEALPDSISEGHSMAETAAGVASGRRVYNDLLRAHNEGHKRVYVLASHSHYFMDGIFNTAYWRANGGVLPGWIVGTAGAIRYPLPPDFKDARAAETNVYGFLLGTVKSGGEISFDYQKLDETAVPAPVVETYTPQFVHWCFAENSAVPH
jgi:Calcineurin-like phosphoesterase